MSEAANTVRPFADSSWLPWAKGLLPELEIQLSKEDARQKRADEKLELYQSDQISIDQFLAQSDEEDLMDVDDLLTKAKPAAPGPSRTVEITDVSSGSTAVDTKEKLAAKSSEKVEGKGKAKAKGKGKEKAVEKAVDKAVEKAVDKPNREPPNVPKNATRVCSLLVFICLVG